MRILLHNFVRNSTVNIDIYGVLLVSIGSLFADPNEWADIFAASGAKYIVLTSKVRFSFTLIYLKSSLNSIMRVSRCGHRNIRSIGMQWMSDQNEIY